MKNKTKILLGCLGVGVSFLIADFVPVKAANSSLFDPLGSLISAKKKKKKAKHNYRTMFATPITEGQNNADATVTSVGGISTTRDYYQRISAPGLSIANPFALNVMSKTNPVTGFEEEGWGLYDRFIMTEGNIWVYYGYDNTYNGTTTYLTYDTNDKRYFTYNGGTEKKVRKHPAYKAYNLSVNGTESNADAIVTPYIYSPTSKYYYRKFAIPNLRTDNLMDYRIYRKDTSLFNGQEAWIPVFSDYFFDNNGNLYLHYGIKNGNSSFFNHENGDYRLFIYSDGKKKKKKLTKQFVKRYSFNAPSGEANADKTVTYADEDYTQYVYYKKFNIPGLRMADMYNMAVLKKSNFVSGFNEESWSPSNYLIKDGSLFVELGEKEVENGTSDYQDLGSGDYRVYLYK